MPHAKARPRRSALYVPGSNQRALDKARTLDADVLLFDLEYGVAPDQKEAARANVANYRPYRIPRMWDCWFA